MAIGGGERIRDRGGALSALADTWLGKLLVGAVAVGLAGYAVWRFAEAVLGRPLEGGEKEGWAKRFALAEVLRQDYGDTLLGLVAGGLLAYGLYCFVEARYREV